MEQLQALQPIFNEKRVKAEKDAKTIQVPQKYLKSTKAERTEAENSTFLHSYSFEINTDKPQYNESVLSCSTHRKLSSLESDQKSPKQISEEAVSESEVILIQHKKYNTENTTQKIQHTCTKRS